MASDQQLLAEYIRHKDYKVVADMFTLNVDSVRGRVSRAIRAQEERVAESRPTVLFGQALPQIARYDAIPYMRGDTIVTGDWHVPTTDWALLELLIKFAEKHMKPGYRNAMLVGDLFNFDMLSKYEQIVSGYGLQTELDYAAAVIDYAVKTLDTLVFTLGNHDERFLKKLNGALSANAFGKLISKHVYTGKLRISTKSQAMVISGGQSWRVTHQRNYSKIKGRVASDISLKHQINTITHHEHHVAIQRDLYNRYTVVNNGMVGDYEKMGYVMLSDSTAGVMCSGFTFIRNGIANLLTPYPTMTDWNMWGLEVEALPVIEAAAARMERLTTPREEILTAQSEVKTAA